MYVRSQMEISEKFLSVVHNKNDALTKKIEIFFLIFFYLAVVLIADHFNFNEIKGEKFFFNYSRICIIYFRNE